MEGSHRDRGTENKRELTCKEIFARESRLFKTPLERKHIAVI